MLKEFVLFVLILNIFACNYAKAAVAHKHEHLANKERMEDGAYVHRNSLHHEGGEHKTEFDHEAILGSVKEAEEFDTLSPEESKRRLAILAKKMDLNQDGFVDRHELKAWILRSFKMLLEEEANDRFEQVDENQDGKITWSEYLQVYYNVEDENSTREGEESKLIQDDKAMFFAADLNHDKILDPQEFMLFQSPEEHPQMLPLILEQTLRDKDLNKDGKIDFKEYIGDTAHDHEKEWLIIEKDKFDNHYDKDKDGVLNGNEILSWVVPSNDEVASEEIDHLFAAADDDLDDRLSYSEIVDNYDIFVGSEATDYGDQLHNIHHFEDEL